MSNLEELRQKLYAECGRNVACRRAADYYIMLIQNPCYPPMENMTYKMRKFYMEIVRRYGMPPRCSVKKLVEERLRGTFLEPYAQEVADFAELLREELHVTSRVAAATATIVVVEKKNIPVVRYDVAARFGVSYNAVRMHLRDAYKLYAYITALV